MAQVPHGSATYYDPAGSFLKEKMPRGHARGQSSNTAIHRPTGDCLQSLRSASFDLGAEQGAGDQSQDGCQVAQATNC